MTDFEIMQRAKSYIDKMANGINPITDKEAAETDMINNVLISRCLFYVSDVLRQVIENGGTVPKVKKKKEPFHLTAEQLSGFRFSDEPIPISEITNRFNALASTEESVQLTRGILTNWLIENGFLQEVKASDGKTLKRPTDQGNKIGIFADHRTGQYGDYTVVLYRREAQQFLVDHLEAILSLAAEEKQKKAAAKTESLEYQGLPWTREHEDRLIDLYIKKVPISEIAETLKRSESGIRSRLKKLGFLN